MSITVEIDQNGRILIPAKMRKLRNWITGTNVILDDKGEGILIQSKSVKIQKAQELFQKMIKNKFKSGQNAVENFLLYKKDEANKEFKKLGI